MIETSESIKALSEALLSVQGDVFGVQRNSANPFHKSKYANLEAVIDAIRGPLQSVGVVFVQAPGRYENGALEITTQLTHAKSGEWMRSTVQIPLAKQDAQAAGSAITYGCRYSLMAMLGVPPVDDDGEGAMGRGNGKGPSAHQARKDGDYPKIEAEMRACKTVKELEKWGLENVARIEALPASWQEHARDEYQRCRNGLKQEAA